MTLWQKYKAQVVLTLLSVLLSVALGAAVQYTLYPPNNQQQRRPAPHAHSHLPQDTQPQPVTLPFTPPFPHRR